MTHVMIIEDDRWQGEMLGDILQQSQFTVTLCSDGQQAIEMIDSQPPDVIVLDLLLPSANGVAFLHEIKSYQDLANIPIVVCTASGLSSSLRQALTQYGVEVVLDKTELEPKQLVDTISKVNRAIYN